MIPRVLLSGVVLTLTLAACGNGGGPAKGPCAGRSGDEQVICNWTESLRHGDTKAAAAYFAVPAFVQNGTPTLRLGSRDAVLVFNESLPCGAKLIGTRRQGRYTVASFRLTRRPGGDCGSGVGGIASTAFLIEKKRIRAWLRVPESDALPQDPRRQAAPQADPGAVV